MKKFLTMLLLAMMTMTVVLTVYAVANPGQMAPVRGYGGYCSKGNGAKHKWGNPTLVGEDCHELVCMNSGCQTVLHEECFNSLPCSASGAEEDTVCQWCGVHIVPVSHTVQFVPNYDKTHDRKCTHADEYGYGPCTYSEVIAEPCTHSGLQIFSDYGSGKGHPVGTQCKDCGDVSIVTNINPKGHLDGYDFKCRYCRFNDSMYD